MKKRGSLWLKWALSLMLVAAWIGNLGIRTAEAAVPAFPGTGSGTAADPYVITTVNGLDWTRNTLSATPKPYFKLGADIDLAGLEWTPIAPDYSGYFNGTLDGNGYTIKNLTIAHNTATLTGLFGQLNGATIMNLNLSNVNVSGSQTGGLAGIMTFNTTVTNVRVTGSVSGTGLTGLLSGAAYYGTKISYAYVTGNSTTSASTAGGVVGELRHTSVIENTDVNATIGNAGYYGGVVAGEQYNGGTIRNVRAIGDLTGIKNQNKSAGSYGGLMGRADQYGIVTNSFASVSGMPSIGGGLCGTGVTVPAVTYSYWDTDVSGITANCTGTGAAGKTTVEMKTASTFADWDSSAWLLEDGQYPKPIFLPAVLIDSSATAATGSGTVQVRDFSANGSPLVESKWATGDLTGNKAAGLAAFRTGGTSFTGTFDVPGPGTYTVYLKNADGGESMKAFTVRSAALAGLTVKEGSGSDIPVSYNVAMATYSAFTSTSVSSVKLFPVTLDPTAAVTVKDENGTTLSGNKSTGYTDPNVHDGKNRYTLKVTSGTAVNTYYLEVYKISQLAISLTASPTAPASSVEVTSNVYGDSNGVSEMRWAAGDKTVSDFSNPAFGNDFTSQMTVTDGVYEAKFTVTANGTYSVYVQDNYGAAYVQTIAISNIQNVNGDTPSTTPSTNDESTGFRVIVNGQPQDRIATGSTRKENGQTVLTATVDTSKLSAQLAKESDKPVVIIPVTQSVDKVTAVLTGEAVKALENKNAVLEVQTPVGTYKLPASEVFIDKISDQLGEPPALTEIVVHVDIAKSDDSKVKLLESRTDETGFEVVVPPVDFTVTATYNGKTVNLDKFSAYVEREIPLPEGVDPSKITTAIVLDADGTTRHVPTYVTKRDGRYYAVVNSLTNSTYSLVWHPVAFKDLSGHWAQEAVNDMGSRMVVSGVNETSFGPDQAITRAEFAAIMVRALGLPETGGKVTFSDVSSDSWYAGAVGKAEEYGLLHGYRDGTFRPNNTITRQEAIYVLVQALKLTGWTAAEGSNSAALLSGFTDAAKVESWAKQAIAEAVQSGLVVGANEKIKPKNGITRAETAALVQRLLKTAKLIDNGTDQ
ncbi:S-layer homology domain-containing protein [Cohnella candidum]|nr:S-layer homology domain-containing protein [Cohnella candidum]